MYAAVDLGSNSFRLHVGEPEGDQMRIVRSARQPIRLASGLDQDGMLTEPAIQRALRCLEEFSAILKEQRLDEVRVVATSTLRVAKNAAAFLPLAESAIGYPIEVISGEEEGRLIYMGVARALGNAPGRRLVIDIGGGSTEIVLGDGAEVGAVESFTIGTQSHSAAFFRDGQLTMDAFDAAIMAARARFEDAAEWYRAQASGATYGSSGTIRAIADVIAKNGIGDGTLSRESLLALRDRLVAFGHVGAVDLSGIKRERVPVMVGGLAVLIGVLQELGIERMRAINAGLRLGVLSDLELRANRHDRRDQAILACIRRFGVDEPRALRTAALAHKLYTTLAPHDETLAPYLRWSCMLHEVGQAVSHSGAHKHAAYIVEHADLPGFTTREQRTMATLVVGQKGNLRKIRDALADPDFAKAVLALRLAAMLMHARIGDADIGGLKLQMKSRIEIEAPRDWMAGHPTVACWLDQEREWWTEVDRPLTVRLV
jgi:exopolyphosphatase/guanosine-5'-triphosphate,3'-diphosphate pyrophosphatase